MMRETPELRLRENHKQYRDELSKRSISFLYHATYSAALSAIDHTGGLWSNKWSSRPTLKSAAFVTEGGVKTKGVLRRG